MRRGGEKQEEVSMKFQPLLRNMGGAALLALAIQAVPASAAPAAAQTVAQPMTYADLADLVDPANVVLEAKIRKQAVVEPERSRGLRPGWVRLYMEAKTLGVLAGREGFGELVRYLVDVPLGANGRVPNLKGNAVLLFGYRVPNRPAELQLVKPNAQLISGEPLKASLRPMLAEFFAPDAPARITGIRDILWVPGNLAGESETQMFLRTDGGAPAVVSVIRRPGQKPVWSASWSELVDEGAGPPARDTLAWYRLACSLPPTLPPEAQLGQNAVSRANGEIDYRFVKEQLGPCERRRP